MTLPIIAEFHRNVRASHQAHVLDGREIEALLPLIREHLSELRNASARYFDAGRGVVELSITLTIPADEI